MSQISQVSQLLKKLLREKNITYRDVAKQLSMSEANIKRIFANDSFSLTRLEELCHCVDITLSNLFYLLDQQSKQISQLTIEQEQQIIANSKLFLVAVCVRDYWKFDEIINHYQISKHECIRMLAKLDKLKLIQLLPNNEYKLLIAQDFSWIPNGPLEQYMTQEVISQFMASAFIEQNAFRFYLSGSYSQSSIDIIQRKFKQLTKEVALLNQEDAELPLVNKQHMGFFVAMRPWELTRFAKLRR